MDATLPLSLTTDTMQPTSLTTTFPRNASTTTEGQSNCRTKTRAEYDKGAKDICKAIARSVNCALNVTSIHSILKDELNSRPATVVPLRFLMVLFHQALDARESLLELE